MDDIEETVAVDTDTDVEEATDSNENSEQEDTGAVQERLDQAETAKSQILARARKAEAELKQLKEAQAKPHINNSPQLSDELKLIARGLSDEEIDQAKVIAKGKDIVLAEAIKDPLFLFYQATLRENEKKEKAKLGASKGSGESQEAISGTEYGTSRDEHEKAFKKVMGI